MRATSRMADISINTVTKLLVDIGGACADYQDGIMRNLSCKRLQCDEIWSFVGMKERSVPVWMKGTFGVGDVYTWTAIDADTKLAPCWHIGIRDVASAQIFIADLASGMAGRVQLTTDGHRPYLSAVDGAFGPDIDYAMLVKLYGAPEGNKNERRYSPAQCCGAEKTVICGNPDAEHISTSFVERQNLTMRMSMRRFTRLTNGFSKKIENLEHAVALHFMHYNFGRIHKTLRVTPAMEAGLDDHVWTMEEVVTMADRSG